MIERWGDSQRDRNELDRWITTEPENFNDYDTCDKCGHDRKDHICSPQVCLTCPIEDKCLGFKEIP